MVDMLTRKEVQDQLSSITKQVNAGYGVKGGANRRIALEDAYAYWLAANQGRVKMKDFADFLQLDADAAKNAYLPEGGFGFRDVVDFDEIDFEGIAGPPPRGYTGDTDYESIQDDNFDALFDRIDAARTADPFVAYTPPEEPYTFTPPTPAQDFRNIRMNDYATVADLAAQNKIAQGLFNPLSFNTRDITRGTPAVTRGLDAMGNPTTAITMGDTTAVGTGPNIGQLSTELTFPSTGMGINADGTGTVATGTMDTTGNIVKLDPDVTGVNLLQTDAGTTSTLDPNATPKFTGTITEDFINRYPNAGDDNTANPTGMVGGGDSIGDVGFPPPTIVQQIAQIVRDAEASLGGDFSEAAKAKAIQDGKAQIAALGMATPGGISAGQIAAGGQLSGASNLLNLDTDATVGAVRDVIDREYQTGFSADTPYMVDDETVYTFNQGGSVAEPADAYEQFTMSVSMGPEEISMQRRQQGVQNLMNTRSGIQPSDKMLSALDRIMGRENG
jgi:hypothetical protein